ncbi:MAG: hypothetical protein IJM30_03830 [Thermoguttaceae bacterium]|nr:hypothetical protein [Thermoguttaceae bacterium]
MTGSSAILDALARSARASESAGRWDEAARLWERAAERGLVRFRQATESRDASAIESFRERTIGAVLRLVEARGKTRETGKALSALSDPRFRCLFPRDDARPSLARIGALTRAGRYEEACEACEALSRRKPEKRAFLLYYRARCAALRSRDVADATERVAFLETRLRPILAELRALKGVPGIAEREAAILKLPSEFGSLPSASDGRLIDEDVKELLASQYELEANLRVVVDRTMSRRPSKRAGRFNWIVRESLNELGETNPVVYNAFFRDGCSRVRRENPDTFERMRLWELFYKRELRFDDIKKSAKIRRRTLKRFSVEVDWYELADRFLAENGWSDEGGTFDFDTFAWVKETLLTDLRDFVVAFWTPAPGGAPDSCFQGAFDSFGSAAEWKSFFDANIRALRNDLAHANADKISREARDRFRSACELIYRARRRG